MGTNVNVNERMSKTNEVWEDSDKRVNCSGSSEFREKFDRE